MLQLMPLPLPPIISCIINAGIANILFWYQHTPGHPGKEAFIWVVLLGSYCSKPNSFVQH